MEGTISGLAVRRRDESGSVTIDADAVEAFRSSQRGPCLTAQDEGYDAARVIWNGSIDKRPAMIARCVGAGGVMGAVDFARQYDLLMAVRGGGHNVAGNAMCDDGLVI